MAITAERSPYKMTEVGDDLASVFQGRDMLDTTPVVKFRCSQIRVFFGGAGLCTLLNQPGGELIFRGQAANAGDVAETNFATPIWFDGCYVQDLPADSEVYLYVD